MSAYLHSVYQDNVPMHYNDIFYGPMNDFISDQNVIYTIFIYVPNRVFFVPIKAVLKGTYNLCLLCLEYK